MENQKFSLEYREDGVFISASEGADYSMSSVVGYIKSRGLEEYNGDAVMTFVSQKDGAPVKIAERNPENEKDAELEVKVSSDGRPKGHLAAAPSMREGSNRRPVDWA
jgi:hypothetical protein